MFNETEFGFEYTMTTHFIFFGKINCTLNILQHIYPQFIFRHTKQTHSDILIHSTTGSEQAEADAHWTAEKYIALVVKTADCIPVLVYDEIKNIALAVHAGWRGVQNQITLKAFNQISASSNLKIYIGPHIQKFSFACDLDIKNLLNPNDSQFEFKNAKYYVDLKSILKSQINSNAFMDLNMDTFTNLNFHSFRRDKQNSGRNLSFIVKLI